MYRDVPIFSHEPEGVPVTRAPDDSVPTFAYRVPGPLRTLRDGVLQTTRVTVAASAGTGAAMAAPAATRANAARRATKRFLLRVTDKGAILPEKRQRRWTGRARGNAVGRHSSVG